MVSEADVEVSKIGSVQTCLVEELGMTIDEEVALKQIETAIKSIEVAMMYPKGYSSASYHDLFGMKKVLSEIQDEIQSGGHHWA